MPEPISAIKPPTSLVRRCMSALLLPLLIVGICGAAEPAVKTDTGTKGYNCLLMGHSFFGPIALQFGEHPARCGFPAHRQVVVTHSGANGSPGKLWASRSKDVIQAKELLVTGQVDLLGLTCYTAVGSDISDYRNWIDLALQYNPKTRIFIQLPWSMYLGRTLAEYEAEVAKGTVALHQRIDQLRQIYPQTTFIFIPQAATMTALWRLYDQGKLPEVQVLHLDNKEDQRSCLFKDDIGHGGKVPVDMGGLLWLAIIYKVDLKTYQYSTNTQFDLKALAQEIAAKDPYCGLDAAGGNKQ